MDNRSIPLRHSEFLYFVTYNFSKVLFFTFDYQDIGKFAKKSLLKISVYRQSTLRIF